MRDPETTSQAILNAASQLLRTNTFDEIAYRDLGEMTGVSERTVYRHFPTRSHLLTDLAVLLEDTHFLLDPFATWDQLNHAVGQRFQQFDDAPAFAFVLARADAISPLEKSHPSFVAQALVALIEQTLPRLSVRDTRRVSSVLCHCASAQYWARCRSELGMSAQEITGAFRGLSAQLLATFPGQLGFGLREETAVP